MQSIKVNERTNSKAIPSGALEQTLGPWWWWLLASEEARLLCILTIQVRIPLKSTNSFSVKMMLG